MAGAMTPPPADLVPILEKAGQYVTRYARAFSNLVAEETAYQRSQREAPKLRALRSDLVFVSLPGPLPWTTFRDVFEIDGQRVLDRESSLLALFQRYPLSDAVDRANALLQRGRRHDIGTVARTVNIPTLALLFLSPENQPRFRFERGGGRHVAGFYGVEVSFREDARPTLVHDARRGDVPASGRFFIDADRGTVLLSEVAYDFGARQAVARVTTEYRREAGLDIFVPASMKELYYDKGLQGRVFNDDLEVTSRYSKYRRFEVKIENERVRIDTPQTP